MAITPNTLEDISFAEMHMAYVAKRSPDEMMRAEAQTMLGIIRLLDYKRPSWRGQLLNELASKDVKREVADLLLRRLNVEQLMDDYFDSLINKSGYSDV
jgi:hypothetical protein